MCSQSGEGETLLSNFACHLPPNHFKDEDLAKDFPAFFLLALSPPFLSRLSFLPFSSRHPPPSPPPPPGLAVVVASAPGKSQASKTGVSSAQCRKKAALEFLLSDVTPIAQHLLHAVHLLGCRRLTELRTLIELKTENILIIASKNKQAASLLPPLMYLLT